MARMGRRRKKDLNLPERVYLHGRWFRYAHPDGTYTKLGTTEAAMLEALEAIVLGDDEIRTMRELLDHYQLRELPKRAQTTHADLRRYIGIWRKAVGHFMPDQVKPKVIYQVMDLMKPVAGNRAVALLSDVYRYGIRRGVAEDNPCRLVRRNRERPRDRYVTDEEVAAVQAIAPPVVRLAMEIAVVTGYDLGVILGIRLEDLRDGTLYAGRTKTGRQGKRPYRLVGRLAAAVEEARGLRRRHDMPLLSAYLLPNSRGQRYTVSGFESLWQRVQRRYEAMGGTRFQFRDLRAKAASDSQTLEEAADRLDHSSSAVTKRHYRRKPRPLDPH